MNPAQAPSNPTPQLARGRIARTAWHTIGQTVGLIVIALVAYAVWRGYQNPDLLLDLSALRFC